MNWLIDPTPCGDVQGSDYPRLLGHRKAGPPNRGQSQLRIAGEVVRPATDNVLFRLGPVPLSFLEGQLPEGFENGGRIQVFGGLTTNLRQKAE